MKTNAIMHLPLILSTILPLLVFLPHAEAADLPKWKEILAERARLYGHRNWIVIADSAYPAQSRAGIETVPTGAGQIEVLRETLATLDGMKHVRPVVYTDAELGHVAEKDAPGIEAFRKNLAGTLGSRPVRVLPHEEIIARLDEAGATFKILILKTDLELPYTSVFLELDCGYWNSDSESRLRQALSERGINPTKDQK